MMFLKIKTVKLKRKLTNINIKWKMQKIIDKMNFNKKIWNLNMF